MEALLFVMVLTLAAGLAMPLGAWLTAAPFLQHPWFREQGRHSVLAFGCGTLLAAVVFVLIPGGTEKLTPFVAFFCFCSGGLFFMYLDRLLNRINTPASQLCAMIADFVPESLALGAAFVYSRESGLLLAGLMALQNLPEGFSSEVELTSRGTVSRKKALLMFSLMPFLGPICGAIGYLWLSDMPVIVGMVMLISSGGILYSVVQDLAPQARLDKHWLPTWWAVLGFALGLLGHMMIH